MSSILEAIGNTRLVRLRHCAPENGAELWIDARRSYNVAAQRNCQEG